MDENIKCYIEQFFLLLYFFGDILSRFLGYFEFVLLKHCNSISLYSSVFFFFEIIYFILCHEGGWNYPKCHMAMRFRHASIFVCVWVQETGRMKQLMSYLFFAVINYATNQNIRWLSMCANGSVVIVMSMVTVYLWSCRVVRVCCACICCCCCCVCSFSCHYFLFLVVNEHYGIQNEHRGFDHVTVFEICKLRFSLFRSYAAIFWPNIHNNSLFSWPPLFAHTKSNENGARTKHKMVFTWANFTLYTYVKRNRKKPLYVFLHSDYTHRLVDTLETWIIVSFTAIIKTPCTDAHEMTKRKREKKGSIKRICCCLYSKYLTISMAITQSLKWFRNFSQCWHYRNFAQWNNSFR